MDEGKEEIARNVYGRNLITRETEENKVVLAHNAHGDVVYQTDYLGFSCGYVYDEFGNQILYKSWPRSLGPFEGVEEFDSEPETTTEQVTNIWTRPYSPIDNPYRYAGYEYIDEVKLYDLNARYYNPEIARFLSADPYYNLGNRVIGLYEINVPNAWSIVQANNIYVYCGNNPVIYLDPFGLAPTKEEAAAISDHIYDFSLEDSEDDRTVMGWILIDEYRGRESTKAGVYVRYDDMENPSEYVIAFRGSTLKLNLETLYVWQNNVEQLFSSKSADMWDAINYSVDFANSHSQEITFVGHSKGGAEALSSAIATQKNAIVFNPAKPNYDDYGLSLVNYTGKSISYVVRGEILNEMFGEPGVGEVKYLDTQYTTPWYLYGNAKEIVDMAYSILNHLRPAVFYGINQIKEK